jgi:hypothetical protein
VFLAGEASSSNSTLVGVLSLLEEAPNMGVASGLQLATVTSLASYELCHSCYVESAVNTVHNEYETMVDVA